MELNFYDQFKEYSNTDLLKIVVRPQEYQSEALVAASEILKGRQVSEEDIRTAEEYFDKRDEQVRLKKAKTEAAKNQVADFLEPIIQPGPKVEPGKWINLFLVFIALEYLRAIFVKIRYIIHTIQFLTRENRNGFERVSRDSYIFFSIFFEIAYIIYIPVLFYLLYKKRRWGWMLLFADQLISFLLSIGNSYYFFKYQSVMTTQAASWLFWIFLRGVFVYFLWQDKVSSYFNVPRQIKEKIVMASILLCLAYLAVLKIYFY
ncbi:MAG TPA: hypothetical protein VFI33_12915 [Puia sp.]|nr:hypothetical protein [Puia sp.]